MTFGLYPRLHREALHEGEEAVMGARTTLLVCPACSGDDMEAVSDDEDTDFVCRWCGRRWHVELGWVWQVEVKGARRRPPSLRS